jgi:hypothetical protein
MGVFSRWFKEPTQDLDTLKLSLRDSFGKVATDVAQLKTWVVHLHQIQGSLKEEHHAHRGLTDRELQGITVRLVKLEQDQATLAQYLSQMLNVFSQKAQFEAEYVSKLNKFESELELIKQRRDIKFEPSQIQGQVRTRFEPESVRTQNGLEPQARGFIPSEEKETPRQTNAFEEHLLAKFRAHRKEYVFKKIIEAIKAEELSTNDLEELIVDRKGLCGRTSFFAYLREMRVSGLIDDVLIGKRKILATKDKISKKIVD